MVGIRGTAVSQNLRVNTRAPLSGMLQLLQHHDARTLSHDKPAPVLVKGYGTSLGIRASGEGGQCRKSRNAKGRHRPFRPSCHTGVQLAVLDGTESLPDGIRPGGTGSHYV